MQSIQGTIPDAPCPVAPYPVVPYPAAPYPAAPSSMASSTARLPTAASGTGDILQCLTHPRDLARYAGEIEQLRRRSSPVGITATSDWLALNASLPGCASRTLLLRHDGALQAVFFLNEKLLAGIPTGYFRTSGIQGETAILCEPGREAYFFTLAAEMLLKTHRGFLLLLHLPDDGTAPLGPLSSLSIHNHVETLYWQLPLLPDFDATIAGFGHRTRRNLRLSLRHAQRSGWQLLPHLSPAQAAAAFNDLAPRSSYACPPQAMEERLHLLQNSPGWFAMGLVDQQQRWLSCLIGCRTAQGTEVLWQLNALGYRSTSLCTTMRALMMQEEIRRGGTHVRYIGGTCNLMEHCCAPTRRRQTTLGRPGLRLWLVRLLLRLFPTRAPILRHHI